MLGGGWRESSIEIQLANVIMGTREFESSELQLARFKICLVAQLYSPSPLPPPPVWILIFRNERVKRPSDTGQ